MICFNFIKIKIFCFRSLLTKTKLTILAVEIMASGRDGSDTSSIMRQSAPEPSNTHYESTRLNGKWELQKAIPSLSANGTWAIQFIRLQDLQGNVVTINEQELIQLGVNTKFLFNPCSMTKRF